MKLLPFDLQRALAGDKVVTRDGTIVPELFLCNQEKYNDPIIHPLAARINGSFFTFKLDGRYHRENRFSGYDLFMAPKTVKRWVNFYGTQKAFHYDSEVKAKRCADTGAIAIAVPVEFEEGYGVDHE